MVRPFELTHGLRVLEGQVSPTLAKSKVPALSLSKGRDNLTFRINFGFLLEVSPPPSIGPRSNRRAFRFLLGIRQCERNPVDREPADRVINGDRDWPRGEFEIASAASKTASKQNIPRVPFFALFSAVDRLFTTRGIARDGTGGEERHCA